MVKSIDEVLTQSELAELHQVEDVLGDLGKASILENVLHIECSVNQTGILQVGLYASINNPYQFALQRVKRYHPLVSSASPAIYPSPIPFSAAARQRILRTELSLRTHDIELHKFFLSEKTRRDVGLVVASAHWLKDVSSDFYRLCKIRSPPYATGFDWWGMEKALVIQTPHYAGGSSHCVLVLKNDLMLEENLAQGATVTREPTQTKRYARAQDARVKLIGMYTTEHVCILGK